MQGTASEGGVGGTRGERPARPVGALELARHATRFLRWSRRPPAVYTREGGRHATWLELFFDLVYVVAVAELGALLHDDPTVTGFLGFAGLFLVVWWTWLGFSIYVDQFDTDDLLHRVGMVAVMFGVIALSATIHDALDGGSAAFTLAYLLLRVLYVGMYLRAWLNLPDLRPFLAYVVGATALSAGIWAASLLVPEPGRFAVWGLSFLVSIVVSVIGYVGFENIPRPTSHVSERLGLFTILVLGETVLAVAVGTSGTDWTVGSALTAVAGFLVAVALWWTYFRNLDEWVVDRVYRSGEGSWSRLREVSFAHVMGHYVVYVGIVTVGVGIAVAIEAATAGHALEPSGTAAVAGGIAVFLFGCSFVHRTMPEPLHDRVFAVRLAATALLAVVALLAPPVSPLALVWLVAALLVALNVFEGFRAYLQTRTVAVEP
jgi:low temperature requirement protein LtrA